jgi:hypothetical protein
MLVGERTEAEPNPALEAALEAKAKALDAKAAELAAAAGTVRAAFGILGSRALVVLASLGAFTLFAWAAYEPSGWRFAAACAFTLCVFAPALWIDRRG